MPFRLNLRDRIFFTYPLLGFLISVIVIVFFIVSYDLLERQFMDHFLLEELEHFVESTQLHPQVTEQRARHWAIYQVDATHRQPFLDFLASYPPGTYDVMLRDVMYDVGIAERNGSRYYILYNDQASESLEFKLVAYLVIGVFVIFSAATAYGLWFSKRVLRPIMALAGEVKSLDLAEGETIAVENYAQDEVGFLASEFDNRVNRIKKLIEREREFTANASHELRTPLSVIKTVSEALLLRQNLPEDIRVRLDRIERAANNMTHRLQALLILSREPGKSLLSEESTDVATLLDQLLEDHEFKRATSVTIIKRIFAKPLLRVPHSMLSIVLGNLIDNAFVHTHSGCITIELTQRRLKISDTGRGIPSEQMQLIMKRGYKDRYSQGQGLGLSLVRRICDFYHWQLDIDSVDGQGTTVTLLLSH